MTRSAIGCTVLIDGREISDGCTPFPADDPAVLSGLRIIWGRASTVDQPQPSSCTFDILDPLYGSRLVPALAIGRQVDVRADTVVYPDPNVSTIPAQIPTAVVNAAATATGAKVTTLIANGGGRAASVTFPPRALSSDPLAWDAVPRTLAGQDWRLKAGVTLPSPGFLGWSSWAATIQPVSYTNPDGKDAAVFGDPVPFVGGVVDTTITPPPGVWLGALVRVYPVGPAWQDLDATAWQDVPAAWTWNSLSTFVVRDLDLLAPAAGALDSGLVFSGRITDIAAKWDGGPDAQLSIIAQDWLAELANRWVGDQPWAAEALWQRALRVVGLSGQPVTLNVDAPMGFLPVTYRDVDSQPAASLLQQLATSGAGVLWTATHLVTGQIMRIEDVTNRPAALTLTDVPGGIVRVIPSQAAADNSLPVSACVIDADPVRFILDTTETVSMVAVQWLDQVVDPDNGAIKPTQRTVEISDPIMLSTIGARRLSVSTQLRAQADAEAQANTWLARSSVLSWRIEGLSWDTAGDLSTAEIEPLMTLLDGTRRNGLPILLTDLPEWAGPMVGGQDQVALYVEGGQYDYTGGAWTLALTTSSATGSAAGSFPWQAADPGWQWQEMAPEVTWLDLYGVTYPDVI